MPGPLEEVPLGNGPMRPACPMVVVARIGSMPTGRGRLGLEADGFDEASRRCRPAACHPATLVGHQLEALEEDCLDSPPHVPQRSWPRKVGGGPAPGGDEEAAGP